MFSNAVASRPRAGGGRRFACQSVRRWHPAPAHGSRHRRRASAASSTNMVDELRIERAAGLVLQHRDRAFRIERAMVRPLGRHRVVVVDDCQNARADRNLLARETLRIALAVPPFVMAEDQRRHRIGERHRGDDLRADLRVNADLLELLLRQRSGLRQDVLGHRQLADVVQQRRGLDALNLVRRAGRPPSPGRPRRPARAGCATASTDPSRRWRGRALRLSPDADPRSAGRAAARPRSGPCRPCRCDRSDRWARTSAAPSSSRPTDAAHTAARRCRRRRNSSARSRENSRATCRRYAASVDNAIAAATRPVLIRKYVTAAPASGGASTRILRRPAAEGSRRREAGAFDRQHERRHAEQRPMHRRPVLVFRIWHWLKALPAATTIVPCGPRASSDAKSTAYDTDIVELLVIERQLDFGARPWRTRATGGARNSNGLSNRASGRQTQSARRRRRR